MSQISLFFLFFFFFLRKKQGVGLGWYPIFYKFSLFSFQILPFLHDLVLNVMLVWYWFGFVRHIGKLGRWLVLMQIVLLWFLQIRTIILSQLASQVLANHILQWRWVLSMHASIGTITLSQLYYWFLTNPILYWSLIVTKDSLFMWKRPGRSIGHTRTHTWVLFKHAYISTCITYE